MVRLTEGLSVIEIKERGVIAAVGLDVINDVGGSRNAILRAHTAKRLDS